MGYIYVCLSVAVIKTPYKNNLKEKGIILMYSPRGIQFLVVRKMCSPSKHSGRTSIKGSRVPEQEVGLGY